MRIRLRKSKKAMALLVTLGIFAGLLCVRWSRDRDFDGLTDKEEAAIGTDPKNPNTDGDRLGDSKDPYPLRYDYPEPDAKVLNWVDTTDYSALAALVNQTPPGQVPKDIPRFTRTYEIVVYNRGTDMMKQGEVSLWGIIQWFRPPPTSAFTAVCTMSMTFRRLYPNQNMTYKGSINIELTDFWEQIREAVETQERPAVSLKIGFHFHGQDPN